MIRRLLQPTAELLDDPSPGNIARTAGITALALAAYGFTTGFWRSPVMGFYVAVKMPLLVACTLGCNGMLNGLLGLLLGGVGFRQSMLALLSAFASAALILGSLAPVTLMLALNAPPPHSPEASSAHAGYLLFHVFLIAIAGIAGTLALFKILLQRCSSKGIAITTILAWLAGNGFLGAQFSWILRPFFGTPTIEVQFLREHPMRGSFYEAVWHSLKAIWFKLERATDGNALLTVCGVIAALVLIAIPFILTLRLLNPNSITTMNNDTPPNPPFHPNPPFTPSSPPPGPPAPPTPEALPERLDLRSILSALLRNPGSLIMRLADPGNGAIYRFIGIVIFSMAVFGLVLGSFAMNEQLWAAPLKITLGLLIAGLICFPSLYIFSCLAGSRAEAGQLAASLAGMLALAGLLLLGFAPAVWIFTQATNAFGFMGLLSLLSWLVAVGFGIRFLKTAVAMTGASSKGPLAVWSCLFLLVTLQMTTSLRPILGHSERFLTDEKKFFVQHWIDVAGKSLPEKPATTTTSR